MVPERKARLLLVSSQARPPSSNESFQKACMDFTDSMVSLELRTTLPFSSTSCPPHDQRCGWLKVGASPKVWPSVWPSGLPLAFSFLPASWYCSQVSGNLLKPTSSNQDLRYAIIAPMTAQGTDSVFLPSDVFALARL